MSKSILIINEDQQIINIWKEQLNQIEEYEVILEKSLLQCQNKLKKKKFDLIILDENITLNGIKSIYKINQNSLLFQSKIIILQNKNSKIKKFIDIEKFFSKSIVFIQKPLKVFEFLQNVNSILNKQASLSVKINQNIVFIDDQKIFKDNNGKQLIKLTDKEALILKQMINFQGKVVSKKNLLKSVWGYRQDISTSTVESHIYRLRKKLHKIFPKTIIFTSKNGYKFFGF